MKSNLVVNLNKIRAANSSDCPAESSVLVFDYFAPESEAGEHYQQPLVRVVSDSLRKTDSGVWMFRGVNLYRIDETTTQASSAVRTFRLDRINGIVRKPS